MLLNFVIQRQGHKTNQQISNTILKKDTNEHEQCKLTFHKALEEGSYYWRRRSYQCLNVLKYDWEWNNLLPVEEPG